MKLNDTNMAEHMRLVRKYQKEIPEERLRELIRRAKNGDKEAMDEIVMSNLALVIHVAKRYVGTAPMEDIMNMGILGFYDAVRHFDLDRGTKFSTYVVWWIRQHISRETKQYQNAVSMPDHMYHVAYRLRKITKNTGWDDDVVLDDETLVRANVTRREYERLRNSARAVPLPELRDDDKDIFELIGDADESIEQLEDKDIAEQAVARARSVLTDLQFSIFYEHFVVGKSLREISRERQVSFQAVSEISKKSLRKVRECLMIDPC